MAIEGWPEHVIALLHSRGSCSPHDRCRGDGCRRCDRSRRCRLAFCRRWRARSSGRRPTRRARSCDTRLHSRGRAKAGRDAAAHGGTSSTTPAGNAASRATGAFQCLVSALDRQGYPIRFMGGWRAHGSVHGSLHPAGLALDINQYGRNVTRPRMPRNEIALANSCGLIAGAQWANADSGHFQLGGWSGGRHEARRRHRRRAHYANARW